jgi:NADPH2:quinone reductase
MKAVICREFGPIENLVWTDTEAKACGPTQVRLRTTVATLGFMDTLMVRGLYQHKPELPFIPGAVSGGVVTEVGSEVKGIRVGQRVTASDYGGAYAEERVVSESDVVVTPQGLEDVQAAAGRLTFLPSYLALVTRGNLRQGETLVVTGAAGGTGFAALELGRHLGARVIAAVGSPEKEAFVRRQGYAETIDYSRESFKDRVNELTGGKGADVIFDVVGGDLLEQSLRCVNVDGRILVVGFAGGRVPSIPANLPLLKNAAVIGSFLGGWRRRHPERFAAIHADVQRLVTGYGLRMPIERTFPMSQAAEAMNLLVARKAIGVVALEP